MEITGKADISLPTSRAILEKKKNIFCPTTGDRGLLKSSRRLD